MSIVSHVSIGTNPDKLAAMLTCYDALLAEIGAKRQLAISREGAHVTNDDTPVEQLAAVAYGKYYPEFWVGLPHDQKDASVGNGTHVAFQCRNAEEVKRVYDAALASGAKDNGAPGKREHYGDRYYGAFFIDPAGNKMEATFYDMGIWGYCDIL